MFYKKIDVLNTLATIELIFELKANNLTKEGKEILKYEEQKVFVLLNRNAYLCKKHLKKDIIKEPILKQHFENINTYITEITNINKCENPIQLPLEYIKRGSKKELAIKKTIKPIKKLLQKKIISKSVESIGRNLIKSKSK